MMLKVTVAALLFVMVAGTMEFHHYVQEVDGIDINQDIVFDEDDQIVIITVSPAPQLGCQIPTINFHDYKTGYVAFKDVNASKCYLTRPPTKEMTPEIYRMKKSSLSIVSHATFSEDLISPEELREIAGERIHDACLDYDTYWMELEIEAIGGRRKKRAAATKEPCWFACVFCLIEF